MNLGRNQLLAWVNQVMQCEYSTIEMLSDGIGYSQILDAIHPNAVNVSRLNLSAKYPDDCLRNLRILQSALKKLKITQPFSFQKISQKKFQDNILFLQWIYAYSVKYGSQSLQGYEPYNRRLQILQRQGKDIEQMSPHLIPTQAYMSFDKNYQEYEQQNDMRYDQNEMVDEESMIEQKKQEMSYRISQLKDDTTSLEGEMKTQMETNWKLMHNIQRSIEERNTLYLLLKQIQTIVKQSDNSSVGAGIFSVLQEIPQDFA